MDSEARQPCLFLYGSLLTGTSDRRLNKKVRRLLRHAQPAVIQARLYNLGRYPGVVASTSAADRVYGWIITQKSHRFIRQLDHYEDYYANDHNKSEFIRVLMQAKQLPSQRPIDCWVYVYNRHISGKQRIKSGDYMRFRRARRRWADQPAPST
jgi:gamma-glutamylcyclotransferase (GGCT)/AIG2-like uncharacterized protein YtfP